MKRQITGKRVINTIAFVLAFFVCFFLKAEMVSAETVASGTTGSTNNIEWVLDDQGVLTITGEGEMPDYTTSYDTEHGCYISTAPWYIYANNILSVVIGDEVRNVGNRAFIYCNNLTSVYLSSNILSIGEWAFNGCPIDSIIIPEGVQSIEEGAFASCSSLTSINISENIISIGEWAFNGCPIDSIIIPEGVQSIGNYAFYACSSLATIFISEGVQSIGIDAFSGCPISAIYFSNSEEVWDDWKARTTRSWIITEFPVYYCSSSGNFVNSQSEKFHWGVYDDGSLFISGYGDMPDFSEEIVPWYSQNATIITAIIREGITRLGNNAFAGCDNLTNIYLPDSLLSIGISAFELCSGLEFISIPDKVESIGDNAFSFCSSLSGIIIPTSLIDIGTGVFNGCSNMAGVYYLGTLSEWNEIPEFDTRDSLDSILHYINATGTAGTHIVWFLFDDGFMNFSGHGSMTNYTSPADTLWYQYRTKIKSIRTDYKIVNIGAYAFDGYNRITTFVANSYISIGNYSFRDNTFLTCVKSIKGLRNIGSMSFSGCAKLTVLPHIIGSVGDDAFYNCSNLITASIEGSIGNRVFYNCNKLESVYIGNNVSVINPSVFYNCSSLKIIIIPDSVTNIGSNAFWGCSSLEAIHIPDSVVSIGSSAFSACAKLSAIHLPEKITSISDSSFADCTSLDTIIIPDNVNEIASSAFSGCTSLKTIVLPEGISIIGDRSFSSCSGLTDVYYKGTEADWNTYITIGTSNEYLTNASLHFGLSQAATNVHTAIANIGTVQYTAECWSKVDAAIELYNALSDLDKSMVTNYSVLTAAEKSFTDLELTDTPNAVLITSRISGGTMSVIPVSGGGMYYSIRGGDIQAYASVYYNFVGWYQDYGTATEIKLGTSLKLHVVPQETMNITAVYQPVKGKTFSVTIAADSFTYCDDETIFSGEKTFTCTPGQEITITYTDDSRDFINWIGKDRQPVSRKKTITLVVTGNMSIESNSVAKGAGGNCAMVYFDDENGNAILSQFYYSIDSIVFPNPPAVSGKSFEKWSMTAYEIKKKMATDYFIHVIAVYAETPE